MLLLFGLFFLFARIILRLVQDTFTRCWLLLKNFWTWRFGQRLLYGVLSSISPSFFNQMIYKVSQIDHIRNKRKIIESCEDDGVSQKCSWSYREAAIDRQRLIGINVRNEPSSEEAKSNIFHLSFDFVVGVTVYIIIMQISSPKLIASYFISWRNTTHRLLNELLDWLMGAPAGLKLNNEMTHFFGNFFLYHIYIWIGYLSILEPYYILIVNAIMCSSLLGLSVMLSLANDTLGFLTIHTYCFYVYVSKVYKLQLQGLISLSRLMRGKKWNPLRSRVDSVPFDANQLAFGTILFTILLFLLPTTCVYYLVFTLLRLPVIMLKTVIYCSVKMLNSIPAYEVFQIMFSLKSCTDEVSLHLCYGGTPEEFVSERHPHALVQLSRHVALTLNYHGMTVLKLLHRKTDCGFPNLIQLKILLKSLLMGNIIGRINTDSCTL